MLENVCLYKYTTMVSYKHEWLKRSGRPNKVVTPQKNEKIYKVLTNRRSKGLEAIDVSYGSLVSILNGNLGIRKLS